MMSVYVRRFLPQICKNEGLLSRANVQTLQSYGVKEYPILNYATKAKTTPPKSKFNMAKRNSKLLAIGFGIGALGGLGYMYDLYKRISKPVSNPSEGGQYILKDKPPEFTPARSIRVPTDTSGLKITLFQYQTCPFCCKVRAFLDYYGFSYDVIEVNSVTRTQTKWTDYRKVPFLVVELPNSDTVLQLKDSSMIVSVLQSYLDNKSEGIDDLVKCYPTMAFTDDEGASRLEIMNRYFLMYGKHPPGRSKEDIVDERKWRKWVDDVLVHVLSPNVYRTPTEAFEAFQWFSKAGNWEEHFSTWERMLVLYVGSAAMYLIGKNLKRKYQLKDDVRESFYEEINIFLRALKKKGTKFMGGDMPNLSDLTVYGVLTAVEGCEAFQDVKGKTKITPWYEQMKDIVTQHGGAKAVAERVTAL